MLQLPINASVEVNLLDVFQTIRQVPEHEQQVHNFVAHVAIFTTRPPEPFLVGGRVCFLDNDGDEIVYTANAVPAVNIGDGAHNALVMFFTTLQKQGRYTVEATIGEETIAETPLIVTGIQPGAQ